MSDYCPECDGYLWDDEKMEEVRCAHEWVDYSPATRAALDLKVKVQKLYAIDLEGLASPLQFAIHTQLWGILHEVMRDGNHVGRLREREDAVKWHRQLSKDWQENADKSGIPLTQIVEWHESCADALEAGEHCE